MTEDARELAQMIKNAKKTTPVKVYLKGDLAGIDEADIEIYGSESFWVIFGDYNDVDKFLKSHQDVIDCYRLENSSRNQALPLLDLTKLNARIEPGAIIREYVKIGDNVIVMMGAVINVGAEIGDRTMIDMNAVIGARGIIGKNCHIGAGAVIAGVLEPPSRKPVVIEDDVMIGANAVILEGVKVGEGAVVGAGSVVTEDVPPRTVVVGAPAKVVKQKDAGTITKTQITECLRE